MKENQETDPGKYDWTTFKYWLGVASYREIKELAMNRKQPLKSMLPHDDDDE